MKANYNVTGNDRKALVAAIENLTGDKAIGHDAVVALMKTVDDYIPQPERPIDQPFLMPVEDVFSITGRGTVATGRVERGTVKVQDTVEIVGPDLRPFSITVPEMRDEAGAPLVEPRTPQMKFYMDLPKAVPPYSLVRRGVDLSAK